MRRKCHRHILLLSGTGDGFNLAKALISMGWEVSVSVVSKKASLSYSQLPLQDLYVGALEGVEGICSVIEKARSFRYGFDWIIDATHPFALVISSNLIEACRKMGQPFLRYERDCHTINEAILINSHQDLLDFNLTNQKLLLAIGEKVLFDATASARLGGAEVFARVLPTVKGVSKALFSDLPQDHLAVLQPLKGGPIGELESALCRKWGITGVLARQSGGYTQKIWQKISQQQGLTLWLIARPNFSNNDFVVRTFSELFDSIKLPAN